ncbi:MAG TPA: hypothetical protein VGO91_02065 [Pyrinomonadaceae bacterium]|nr:hypothetical protein [Pyrinomonadaceae bacterium]
MTLLIKARIVEGFDISNLRKTPRRAQRRIVVRQAHVPDLSYEEMSDMGRDLFDLSRDYENSGEPLLTEEEIETELTRRRGGYVQEDAA